MQARMSNPAMVVPGAMQAVMALGESAKKGGASPRTHALVHLRASQINGCSVCVEMHSQEFKKAGATDEQLFTVAAWREAPYFTDADRSALALAEAITRLSDRPDAVSDEVWEEAVRHFDGSSLAALVLSIATVNLWNRLNAATRQVAGAWKG
ncbi:MAG: carboxymuconolactone decarboxylase family protein [Akkermansiaceae bacterium]|nr:carboxymuconolactone decarboxylase family protein [Armatimonadota bacterium]